MNAKTHVVTDKENNTLGMLSAEQIRYLLDECKLIWFCDDCQEYHPNHDVQWIDIELALKGFGG